MKVESEPDAQELEDILLDHVVFPRFLPNKKPRHFHELELMVRMADSIETLAASIPKQTVDLMKRMRRIHLECTPNVVSDEINSLCPGIYQYYHLIENLCELNKYAM